MVLAGRALMATALATVCLPSMAAAAVQGNPNICASPVSEHGNRAVKCGASNPDRPDKCCDGYACAGGTGFKCVANAEAAASPEDNDGIDSDGTTTYASFYDKFYNYQYEHGGKICGGWRDKSVECGDTDQGKAAKCCPGYECAVGKTTCVNSDERFEPLKEADPVFQKQPIQVNDQITVRDTVFEAVWDCEELEIEVPGRAKGGDLLLLFIGGSAGKKRPEPPTAKDGWETIHSVGRSDLNLVALYRWFDGNDDTLVISGGKNTFAIMSAVSGVDPKKPIVDSVSVRNSAPGKDGRAVAPPAFGVEGGVSVSAFAFDDPQVAQLVNTDTDTDKTAGFETLATSDTGKGDGMAAFVKSTDETAYVGAVYVAGSVQTGGGNDATMTVTLRPDGGPYDKPPEVVAEEVEEEEVDPPPPPPTAAPTVSARPTRSPTASSVSAQQTRSPTAAAAAASPVSARPTPSPVAAPVVTPAPMAATAPTEAPPTGMMTPTAEEGDEGIANDAPSGTSSSAAPFDGGGSVVVLLTRTVLTICVPLVAAALL